MRRSRRLALAVAVTATATLAITQATAAAAQPVDTAAAQQPLTTEEAAALSQDANTPVIVLMRDQPAAATKNTPAATSRAHGIINSQAPLVSELSQVRAQHVRTYTVANAVAATVSKGEAARLAANPNVAAVLPDTLVKGAPLAASQQPATTSTASPSDIPGACPAPGAKPILEPEALPVTHTASDDPTAKTARSLGYTGAGVKVAYIAEGIDVNNPDFIRADG
ncbi:MAG TPA: protease inhibitor I9 family protein, partial [Pseudonocardiaceae bacterium]